MAHFEVIVGNVGTVYSGNNFMQAWNCYKEYVKISKAGRGRAGGEEVVLMHDGEIRSEHPSVMRYRVHLAATIMIYVEAQDQTAAEARADVIAAGEFSTIINEHAGVIKGVDVTDVEEE